MHRSVFPFTVLVGWWPSLLWNVYPSDFLLYSKIFEILIILTMVWPILLSQFRTKRNVSKELIKGMDQLTRKTWDYKNMEKWFVHLLIVLLLQQCIPRYFNDISEVFQLRFDCISRIAHAPPDTAFHIEKEHASGMDLRTVWYAWYYAVFRFGLVLLPAHLHMRVLVSMDLLW